MPSKAGTFLKNARETAGLKNKDVVAALGVNSGWLSEVEAGYKHPNGHLGQLCQLYGITESDIPKFRINKRPKKGEEEEVPSYTEVDVYAKIAKLARQVNDDEIVDLAVLRIIDAA